MIELDALRIVLRALTYVGSIAAAGGVVFALSFPRAADTIRSDIERQIIVGCCLLLLVEPVRYIAFQLAISSGDWSRAFAADLRWMGMQTPMGQAAAIRWIAAAAILTFGLRQTAATTIAAVVLIGSFALEGHTASSEARTALGTSALFIHITAVHWWLGALYPLLVLTRAAKPTTLSNIVETFGRRAIWVVAALLAGGVVVLALLTGARLDLASAYQRRFLLKISLVAMLLSIAARNKLRLTPLLSGDPEAGRAKLRASIKAEILVGLSIVVTTAWALDSSPEG